jgi:galactose mutarotase-like enzyme
VFSISVEDKQYKTYILSDEAAQSQIEVVPERGGIITRWRIQGQEIFYMDEERYANPELTVRGGNPILFPICGNIQDNTYTYNGKQYSLKQHGFARNLPWEVTDQVNQEDKASLTVVLASNKETKAVYPFEFKVAFTYEIQGNSLHIGQEYTNLSSEPMPFSAGFHPYFWVQDKSQLEFEIPGNEYQDNITKETQPYNGNFDFSRDEIDAAFTQISGQSAKVVDKGRQLNLRLDYDNMFSTLVFWTVKGKDFYCLEPWSAPRNAMNTGNNLTVLEPGATCSTFVRYSANFA